jgi:hypothetical protein
MTSTSRRLKGTRWRSIARTAIEGLFQQTAGSIHCKLAQVRSVPSSSASSQVVSRSRSGSVRPLGHTLRKASSTGCSPNPPGTQFETVEASHLF